VGAHLRQITRCTYRQRSLLNVRHHTSGFSQGPTTTAKKLRKTVSGPGRRERSAWPQSPDYLPGKPRH
jgi:hypothetical protein